MPNATMSEMDCVIVPRIPRGLAPAVEGLAREILRQRPRNIYAFAAEHFAELVKFRDKERASGQVVSAKSSLRRNKLPNKRNGSTVDWAKLSNDGNRKDADVAEECRNDRFREFRKCDGSTEAKKSTTRRIATRKATPATASSKRREERTTSSGGRSGWSVNRTVKALEQHSNREYRAISGGVGKMYGGECNEEGTNGKQMERVVVVVGADHPDRRRRRRRPSPRFSSKDPFVRSSSAGNITYAKRVESRADRGENVERFYTVATTATVDKRDYERKLTRRKSADQIAEAISTCVYFKDTDVDIADRKRSRSLVTTPNNHPGRNESNARREKRARRRHVTEDRNLKNEWKSVATEDDRKQKKREKSPETFGDAKEEVSREANEMGEAVVVSDVESRPDSLNGDSLTFDESRTNETANVGTLGRTVVLPSVVRRPQSCSGKCTRNNVRERCERESKRGGEDGAGNNFTLPPISSDGSKSTRRGSNLIELPRLSNDANDATARHEHQPLRHRCEDSTTSRIRKPAESGREEKELFKLELEGITVEIANADYSRKALQAVIGICNGQDSRDNVNARDIVSRNVCPRRCKSVEGSDTIERDVDETQIPRQPAIVQRPRSSCSPKEAGEQQLLLLRDETWKERSLSVTPDSIDLSEKKNSSDKHLESGKKNEKGEMEQEEEEEEEEKDKENQDEGENERQERRCRPNELERKLIEIETMEKSIENALVSSRTMANDFDSQFGESERSIERFSTRNFERDSARNGDDSSRVEDDWTKKNSDKSQSATSNENNDDNIEIDSVGNETSIRKRSNFDNSDNSDNSESSTSFVDEDNNNSDDGDGKYVGEMEQHRRSHSARGIDVSCCYVLTEGSPCEIPETVTTVIIPDKSDDNGVCEIELDDGGTALEHQFGISSCDGEIETKEESKRSGEERREESIRNPFGEYIAPETVAVRYSSSVDAHFLRDVVKDAADRASARREDLANVKEEEENEGDRFSKILQRCTAVDDGRPRRGRIVDASASKSAESVKRKKSSVVERDEKSTSSSVRDWNRLRSKTDRKDGRQTVLSSHVARKNGNSTNDRSTSDHSIVSLSFEQVGPTTYPNVPELNLDSLQDVTISSSTIGESQSKNLLSNESGNVLVSSEDENISLSSFDAFASSDNERKPNNPNDATFESFQSNETRARLFSEPVTETTKTGRNDETESCLEFQNFGKTERFSNDEKESRYVEEEEIARELIRNFIVDNTDAVDSTTSSSSAKLSANGLDTKPSHAEDFVVQFHPSVQRSASKAYLAIGGESSRREKLDNDDDTRAEREEDERTSQEEGRQKETTENEDDEIKETAFSEKERKKGEIAHSGRHTGEFHDSLPLPLVETTCKNILLVYRSKPALQTTDDCLTFPANPYSEIQGRAGIFNVPSPPRRSDKLSPTIVDIFENFHLLVNASNNWTRSSSDASFAPCVVRVSRASDRVRTTDKAGSIPINETSSNSDATDDLREPLVLDDTPRPIVIEEISNTDQLGGEETLSLRKADANLPREIVRLCPCSPPEQLCPCNNVEDKDEARTTSARETTNQLIIDNDDLLTDIDIGSATLPDNVENLEKEGTNEK